MPNRIKTYFLNEVSGFFYLWIIYLFLPALLDPANYTFEINKLAITVFYMGFVAINNFELIPRYLSRGKYALYLVLVFGVLVLFSFLDDYFIEYLFEGHDRLEFSLWDMHYSFIRMGTLLLMFSAFKLVWDHQKRTKKINALEQDRVENELKFLKSQINPHVLFNHLNSIYYHAMQKSDKVPEIVLKLSDLMRYTLYEANDKFVPLEKEIEYIQNFVALEKIRHENQGNVSLKVHGSTNNLQIAPLLLIPFIENSFKHCREAEPEDVCVSIKIVIEEDRIILRVINNSSSNKERNEEDQYGIGLQNVRKRLRLIYPDNHSLQIRNTDSLFIVHLEITLDHVTD